MEPGRRSLLPVSSGSRAHSARSPSKAECSDKEYRLYLLLSTHSHKTFNKVHEEEACHGFILRFTPGFYPDKSGS